jgi:Ca-activated chloride channel family protein
MQAKIARSLNQPVPVRALAGLFLRPAGRLAALLAAGGLAVIACLLRPAVASADGIIICDPGPCPGPRPVFPLAIQYHRVTVTITDQVATTHVDQLFRNDNAFQVEGTYVFPLPADATVNEFAMWMDGQKVEGKVLAADEARQIYQRIVQKSRDPALLEYIGRGAVQASVFPIPPGQTRRIELEYSQVLKAEGGLIRYRYPLNTEKFSALPLEQVSVSVKVVSAQPLRAIYSPSHPISVSRDDDNHFSAGYEANNVTPNADFDLYYSVSSDAIGANLLTYRDPVTGEGFFLLLAAPSLNAPDAAVAAKDVILVLDKSGSMDGEKFQQAQAALKYVLTHLNAEDRFNVIAFSTDLQRFDQGLRPASDASRATAWVDTLRAEGGTDINRALLEALSLKDAAGSETPRPTIVIFLTDGLPTEGEVNPDKILANVAQAAPPDRLVRLFVFGVGNDVDTVLLDSLAEQNHGASAYVRPGQRIDEAVSGFYAKVSTPVLSNLALDFGSVIAETVYPDPLPDLFAGGQLIAVGRYRNPGSAAITLTGVVNGQPQTFTYPDQLFRTSGGDEFVPRLWATRRIGYDLTQIRLHGDQPELIDEIVKLSVRYGIVTPYTSYLVTESNILSEDQRSKVAQDQFNQAQNAPAAPSSGAGAVNQSVTQSALAGAEAPAAPPSDVANQVRTIGDRTFLLSSDVWIDTAFDTAKMKAIPVTFGSADYFSLLSARPELAAPFALGPRVIAFAHDGTAYEVTDQAAPPLAALPTYTPAPASTREPPPPAGTSQPLPPSGTPASAGTPAAPNVTPPVSNGAPATALPPTVSKGSGGPCSSVFLGLGLAALPLALRRKR